MKALSKSDKRKAFIVPKMTYLITLPDNNGKWAIYEGVNIHERYNYLETIRSPNTLTTSVQIYYNFVPSSSTNNDTATLHPVTAYIHIIQKTICELCGRVGHNSDACIIRGPNFLPPSLRINIKQFNALHGDKPTDKPREWNRQLIAVHFKYHTSPLKTSPVFSVIMGRLNHCAIDNGDVEVHP